MRVPYTILRHKRDYHIITKFDLKSLILIPMWYISEGSLNTLKSHASQMLNITTHFWVGSSWPSHGIWRPTLSRSSPHRWSHSEREKDNQLETIKKGQKSNLLHVRESLALDIKTKGAKKKNHLKEFQRNLQNVLNIPKNKDHRKQQRWSQKSLTSIFLCRKY